MTHTPLAKRDWPVHEIVARNRIDDPRKRMHDPAVARRMGFAGALVPGTVVYAYMLHPLLERWGADWFAPRICELALLRPVYDGQCLRIHVRGEDTLQARELLVQALDDTGACVASLQVSTPARMPPPDMRHGLPPGAPPTERLPVTWERIVLGQPFAAEHWAPDVALQHAFCAEADVALPLFLRAAQAPLHPGLIVRRANDVLVHNFRADLGIHVASRIVQHRAVAVGEMLQVRAVPLEKWRRKGHEYVRLYVALTSAGGSPSGTGSANDAHSAEQAVALELFHTMIYRPRGAP